MGEKKQKKMPLIVAILWFISFILWTISFALKASSPYAEESTLVLTAIAALSQLAAAFVNLWRYKRDKNDPDKV